MTSDTLLIWLLTCGIVLEGLVLGLIYRMCHFRRKGATNPIPGLMLLVWMIHIIFLRLFLAPHLTDPNSFMISVCLTLFIFMFSFGAMVYHDDEWNMDEYGRYKSQTSSLR